MEENQTPVVVYDTQITKEKYEKVSKALLPRSRKWLPVVYWISGGLLALSMFFCVLIQSVAYEVFPAITSSQALFCFYVITYS